MRVTLIYISMEWPDSNRRPLLLKRKVLPTELHSNIFIVPRTMGTIYLSSCLNAFEGLNLGTRFAGTSIFLWVNGFTPALALLCTDLKTPNFRSTISSLLLTDERTTSIKASSNLLESNLDTPAL